MRVKVFFCVLFFSITGKYGLLQAVQPPVTFLFKALQMNIWMGGSKVDGAVGMIVDEIIHSDADIIFLNELRDYQGENFISYMVKELNRRGYTFYGKNSSLSVGVLSRFPIDEQETVYPRVKGEKGAILRVLLTVAGRKVTVYAAHLDYRHYACYLPRGYSGSDWKKIAKPVLNEEDILAMNGKSDRKKAVEVFLQRVRLDIEQKHTILLAGDFNEPSHLDWKEDTKKLWGHNGVIVNWDCSRMLYEAGFRDAYRSVYPNPVTHPGFTYPAGNKCAPVAKLTWAPEADERERIDFIYYYPSPFLVPEEAWIVGPVHSVVKGKMKKERSSDCFIRPKRGWPTDHKAVMLSFRVSGLHSENPCNMN